MVVVKSLLMLSYQGDIVPIFVAYIQSLWLVKYKEHVRNNCADEDE